MTVTNMFGFLCFTSIEMLNMLPTNVSFILVHLHYILQMVIKHNCYLPTIFKYKHVKKNLQNCFLLSLVNVEDHRKVNVTVFGYGIGIRCLICRWRSIQTTHAVILMIRTVSIAGERNYCSSNASTTSNTSGYSLSPLKQVEGYMATGK